MITKQLLKLAGVGVVAGTLAGSCSEIVGHFGLKLPNTTGATIQCNTAGNLLTNSDFALVRNPVLTQINFENQRARFIELLATRPESLLAFIFLERNTGTLDIATNFTAQITYHDGIYTINHTEGYSQTTIELTSAEFETITLHALLARFNIAPQNINNLIYTEYFLELDYDLTEEDLAGLQIAYPDLPGNTAQVSVHPYLSMPQDPNQVASQPDLIAIEVRDLTNGRYFVINGDQFSEDASTFTDNYNIAQVTPAEIRAVVLEAREVRRELLESCAIYGEP